MRRRRAILFLLGSRFRFSIWYRLEKGRYFRAAFFCDFYKAYTSRWATSIKSLPIDLEWGILYSEVVSDFHSGMCVKRYAHSKYWKRVPFFALFVWRNDKNGPTKMAFFKHFWTGESFHAHSKIKIWDHIWIQNPPFWVDWHTPYGFSPSESTVFVLLFTKWLYLF